MMNALLKKRAQNLKANKKGFTLVELIVVLVILAILAAIAIPSMMKYVNDARDKTLIAEARNAYTAAQAIASEKLGVNAGAVVTNAVNDGATSSEISKGDTAIVAAADWKGLINEYMDKSASADTITVFVADGATLIKVPTSATTNTTTAGTETAGKVVGLVYKQPTGGKTVYLIPGQEPVVTK